MKVIIAEKPSVARDIAKVLGVTSKQDGYFEGNGYQVSWAFGHLVTLANAKAYGYDKWQLSKLPILPSPFQLTNVESGQKQFNVLKKLMNNASEVICGTDAGREGELIFRYIYELSGCSAPIKRLWISSLTNEAIKGGFQNLKDGNDYDNLYFSAKARSQADWLLGINGTIAFTLGAGSGTVLSIGRVQTPVLGLIAERFLHNQNFKPEDYFVPQLTLNKDLDFKANYSKQFKTKAEAENITNSIGGNVACTKAEKKAKTDNQPLLFDLTTLQREANQRFKFTAQQTLDIMQKLYETHKVLTYPRTDSRYLSEDIYRELPALFEKVSGIKDYAQHIKNVDVANLPKRSVNDAKVSDHHAIIPTGKTSSLSDEESKIFELVSKRFIAAFSPVCQKEVTTYEFGDFKCSGTIIKEAGWRAVEQEVKEGKEEEDVQKLPMISEGENVIVKDKIVQSKKTKPKPIHTESSLLKAMETAGKEIEDDELSKAIKDCGIGTPATRAATIETLLKRNYIERKSNKVIPTKLGLDIYSKLKNISVISPSLTGEWEMKLNKMAEGEYSIDNFMSEIESYTKDIIGQLSQIGKSLNLHKHSCPKCSEPLKEFQKGFGCECGVTIFKNVAGKDISNQIEVLLKDKKTPLLKGFKNKEGKTFDAHLVFNEEFKLQFQFPKREVVEVGVCPTCSKKVVEGAKGYGCSGYKEGCKFVIWKSAFGGNITLKLAKELLTNGVTSKKVKCKSKAGKPYEILLKLEDGKVAPIFEER